METKDKSQLAPRDLLRAYLCDAAIALRAAKPLCQALGEDIDFRLTSECVDAAGILATMLAQMQHADDVRNATIKTQQQRDAARAMHGCAHMPRGVD